MITTSESTNGHSFLFDLYPQEIVLTPQENEILNLSQDPKTFLEAYKKIAQENSLSDIDQRIQNISKTIKDLSQAIPKEYSQLHRELPQIAYCIHYSSNLEKYYIKPSSKRLGPAEASIDYQFLNKAESQQKTFGHMIYVNKRAQTVYLIPKSGFNSQNSSNQNAASNFVGFKINTTQNTFGTVRIINGEEINNVLTGTYLETFRRMIIKCPEIGIDYENRPVFGINIIEKNYSFLNKYDYTLQDAPFNKMTTQEIISLSRDIVKSLNTSHHNGYLHHRINEEKILLQQKPSASEKSSSYTVELTGWENEEATNDLLYKEFYGILEHTSPDFLIKGKFSEPVDPIEIKKSQESYALGKVLLTAILPENFEKILKINDITQKDTDSKEVAEFQRCTSLSQCLEWYQRNYTTLSESNREIVDRELFHVYQTIYKNVKEQIDSYACPKNNPSLNQALHALAELINPQLENRLTCSIVQEKLDHILKNIALN